MKYNFGVSFNTVVETTEIGGGGEVSHTTIDYVGKFKETLIKGVLEHEGNNFMYTEEDPLVGQETDDGYVVVGVFMDSMLQGYGAILFEDVVIEGPIVIE